MTWAHESGYRVGLLADKLGRSPRWLALYFQRTWRLTPHDWLAQLRAQAIEALARAGLPAKVICGRVGLADAASLSRRLKNSHGQTLRALRET